MAALTGHTAVHATLGVATVDSVVLDVVGKSVQITHRGATTNAIYVTVGNTVADTVTPVSLANDTFAVVAGSAGNPLIIEWPAYSVAGALPNTARTVCIKLICATGEPYSVQVINEPFGS